MTEEIKQPSAFAEKYHAEKLLKNPPLERD
jgi:hypothetical protein